MSAKMLMESLQRLFISKKQSVLDDFFTYCRFDQNCHKTLNKLANILDKCGKYQMSMLL